MTGATGFLGVHVVSKLVGTNADKIYCLVRSKGEKITAENRLKTFAKYYFDSTVADLVGTRLIAIDGDITNP